MSPRQAYPGLAIKENKWSLAEVEREARAQIELALKKIPQICHLSGHMGAFTFAPEVLALVNRLAEINMIWKYILPVLK